MDVAGQFAMYRFIICVVLAVGGIASMVFGYRLFVNGAGLYKSIDKLAIKHSEFVVSVSGMSAGAVLIASAIFWGGFAYGARPMLAANNPDGSSTNITQKEPIIAPDRPGPKTEIAQITGKPLVFDQRIIGTIDNVNYDGTYKKWVATLIRTEDKKRINIDINALDVAPNGSVVFSMPMNAVQSKDWLLLK